MVVKHPRTIADTRAADRARKNRERTEARALWIPGPEDIERRHRLELDLFEWLKWYLADIFSDPFRPYHIEMGQAILDGITYAGDKAFAAPRGEGKTSLAEGAMMFCILKGVINFAVLFAATAGDARNSLASIKRYIAESDRLLVDYPEVCVPVREVQGVPSKAHSIIISTAEAKMVNASFQWSGDEVTMPAVPGSVCLGSIVATRGLDSAVRGLKKGSRRPQLAVIDDPDTEDTARSEDQAAKLETRIDRAIAGLAPKGQRMSRVMLTTLQNRTCVSARFTDPQQKPSWQGKRFAFLAHKPDREDLWDEYISLRQSSMLEGDPFARAAHAFYRKHRKQMDAGAKLTNPYSFDGRVLADGSNLQVSALQRYYDFVADNGIDAALSELQNDPPKEASPIESGITDRTILNKLNGYPRRIIPPNCLVLSRGVDVHKTNLFWVVRAWQPDGTGFTIDRGIEEVYGATVGTDEGVELAIIRALRALDEHTQSEPYTTAGGEIHDIDLTLVDARWQKNAVFHACGELGLAWKPAMGVGSSLGCIKGKFHSPAHRTADKKPGDGWYESRQPKRVWLVMCDTDGWKEWEHARWMTPPGRPGSMSIFGEALDGHQRPGVKLRMTVAQKEVFAYAKHIVSEVEIDEGGKRSWRAKTNNNHWFDASYLSDVAANMKGITVLLANSPGAGSDAQKAAVAAAGGWMGPMKGKRKG